MAINLERFKKDLADLRNRGVLLQCAMVRDTQGKEKLKESLGGRKPDNFEEFVKTLPHFKTAYEKWYSECLAVIKQLVPDRLDAFVRQYEKPKNRKGITYDNYVIEDYMIGLQVTRGGGGVIADASAAIPRLQNQNAILGAAEGRFESSLFEIRQLVQADLFDSEIATARELLRSKFLRAAGAIAGVVLEKHLIQVCDDHAIKVTKKNPGISDANELLKASGVIDVPQWRHISMLGDIRNICDHNKQKEPTESQVNDLIDGADKVLRTIA